MEFVKTECNKVPIWVKFSNIPFSYWIDDGINYIASGIGKPLFADEMTSKLDPMNFVIVCIEVNADFSFPSSINVVVFDESTLEDKLITVNIKYQSIPPSCPVCKTFGHPPSKCPKANF